jgi:uncharacterized membrane protein (UPF0136 family)
MHHHPHQHAALVYIVYGVIVLAGGIYGYAKSQSTPSLIAGIGSAVVAGIAAVLFHGHHPRLGVAIGAILGLTLSIVFYRRYSQTQKPMPAIPMGVLSALLFLYSVYVLIQIHGSHPA